ncbi:MAG: hypothetical protein K5866_10930 [Treponema sp.]|nr:hypothetical protein [Treponema sp.]
MENNENTSINAEEKNNSNEIVNENSKEVSKDISKDKSEKKSAKSKKSKKPFIVRFLLAILYLLLAIIVIFIAWMTFSAFDRKSSISGLPKNFSVYVRTDSVWSAVEPLIDLKAADVVLAQPAAANFRETFYKLRETNIRKNKFVDLALSRRVDAALYENNNFLAILDMGFLSGISRLAPFAYNFISLENLIYVKAGEKSHFEYQLENMTLYIQTQKNLVLLSDNKNLFEKALTFNNDLEYSPKEIDFLKEKLDQPFRIAANAKKLLDLMGNENPYVKFISNSLDQEDLSSINFGITDENINLAVKIPFEQSQSQENALMNLVSRNSEIPDLLTKLPESVQYYTIINVGTLSELKDAAFTVMDEGSKNINKIWDEANEVSKTVFKDSLDNILFSWTSDEYAVLGLEGKPDPVFALRVEDEKKRQFIFESILSSIVLKTDNSLLLDGIRLPRIEFPSFFRSVLEAFGVNLPKPYYMVKDGFIYFSQSPENLASMNAAIKNGAKLSKNETWNSVSKGQAVASSISLYYNLERSIPFFVKGNSIFSKILQLYNIGKIDVSTKNNTISVNLNSVYCESTDTQSLEGFPMELQDNTIPLLYKSNDEKTTVFWQEKSGLVKALNTSSLKSKERKIDGLAWILPASASTVKKTGGQLWALTKEGNVFLMDADLENVGIFPIITGENPSCQPVVNGDDLIIVSQNNSLIYVNSQANISSQGLDMFDQIKAAPSVYKDKIAFYEKGFLGGIHLMNQKVSSQEDKILPVDGIAYGTPYFFEANHQTYLAFITQAGILTIWDLKGQVLNNFPMTLDGVFYLNVKAANGQVIALSQDGTIFKVSLEGNVTKVKIPHLSAKSGYLTILDYDNDKNEEIFISGESNTIYGFNKDLEFLNSFPLTGYGLPVFTDLNGDKKIDCLVLSIDKKLNAWKIK